MTPVSTLLASRRRLMTVSATLALASLTPFVLSGCTKGAETSQAAASWRDGGIKDPVNAFSQISGIAKGISVGSEKAARTAYVIFDPRCIHCAKLWASAEPVVQEGKVRFVWIPVGLTSKESLVVASAIWESPNPVEAMKINEKSVAEKTGGIKLAALPSEAAMTVIKENGQLAEIVGLQEVPILLIKDKNGKAIVSAGALETDRLREFLAR